MESSTSLQSEQLTREMNPDSSINGRRSRPPPTHVAAVLAAVILPITLTPYLLARRQVSMLRKQVATLEIRLQSLQRDIHSMVNDSGSVKDEHRRIRGLLHEMMTNAEELRLQTQEATASQRAVNETTQSELQRLLEEARLTRAQGDVLRVLGCSLADIASFMHEVELSMPVDMISGEKNRVEQLRLLAFRLENLPGPKSADKTPEKSTA
ncbi:hypothetical protein K435DRAFT_961232 [Dendrothele bispora CBS 962.96]|uniref:Uncharacterized protein n=1 Tax=Dendrothele bispora (strain CBS 962.96) TaxID=1314807 RepID=A0A4S8MRL9_DENBC|nr:hypothetical protein K435DRAFT_961232 [Dendrothele bispora CBS 962.96]